MTTKRPIILSLAEAARSRREQERERRECERNAAWAEKWKLVRDAFLDGMRGEDLERAVETLTIGEEGRR